MTEIRAHVRASQGTWKYEDFRAATLSPIKAEHSSEAIDVNLMHGSQSAAWKVQQHSPDGSA